jgi:hypothetical protein
MVQADTYVITTRQPHSLLVILQPTLNIFARHGAQPENTTHQSNTNPKLLVNDEHKYEILTSHQLTAN